MRNFLLINFCLIAASFGESSKSREAIDFMNLSASVRISLEKGGENPHTWRNILDKGYLSETQAKKYRKSISFDSKFGFLEDSPQFDLVFPPEKIILMAIVASEESNKVTVEGNPVKGRWLLVSVPDGQIQTRWRPEEQIAAMFKEEGLNLDDYTGIDGNWENSAELRENQAQGTFPEKIKSSYGLPESSNPSPNTQREVEGIAPTDKSDIELNNIQSEDQKFLDWKWITGIGTGILLAGYVAFVFRNRRQQKPR